MKAAIKICQDFASFYKGVDTATLDTRLRISLLQMAVDFAKFEAKLNREAAKLKDKPDGK